MDNKDIWDELDAMYRLPEREAGDIDSFQFSSRYGISPTNALRRMKALVEAGEYKYVWVKDITTSQGRRKIIRKIRL